MFNYITLIVTSGCILSFFAIFGKMAWKNHKEKSKGCNDQNNYHAL